MFCSLCIALSVLVLYYIFDSFLRIFKVGNYGTKAVLITGCDSGFGRALAIRLDSLGFVVFASCLTEDGKKFLTEACSDRLTTFLLNVTDESSRLAALEFVRSKLPENEGLWAYVNNAGTYTQNLPSELCRIDEYRQVFEVNFYGPVEMTRLFLPLIRKAKGRVVFMLSIMTRIPVGTGPYAPSKMALKGFGEILRKEMLSKGVKVCMLEPGSFVTGLTKTLKSSSYLEKLNIDPAILKDYEQEIKVALQLPYTFEKVANKDITPVINAYTHAVTAKYPRTHYLIGKDAWLFMNPITYLPTWISDLVFAAILIIEYPF